MSGDQADGKTAPKTNNEKIGKEEEYGYYFYPERGGKKLEKPWYTSWIGQGRAASRHFHCLAHVNKCSKSSK